MRPRNQAARDQLARLLQRRAVASTAELAAQAGVSVPTLHRLLQALGDALVTTGKARRTRHALRRPSRGDLAALPLYRIDGQGRADQIASLALVHPQGSCLDLTGSAWPVPDESRDGWWAGLPYPLYDMRPQGYLGRQLARAEHQALGVAPHPEAWGDDDVVQVLSRVGCDVSGNLSLRPVALAGSAAAALQLAPVYDMLPMRYAPLPGGEVPPRGFDPPTPLPPQRSAWLLACEAATAFWARAAQDRRISAGFRALCGANAQSLQMLAARV